MKRKIFVVLLCFCGLSVALASAEQTKLCLYRADGTVVKTVVDEALVLEFIKSGLADKLSFRRSSTPPIDLSEVRKLTFENAPSPDRPDDPDPLEPTYDASTMYVHYTNGTTFYASLDEVGVLRFLNENLKISLLERAPMVMEVSRVRKITFGSSPIEEAVIETPSQLSDVVILAYCGQIVLQSSEAMQRVAVWNLQGQQMLYRTLGGVQSAEINASHLPQGLYVVRVETDKTVETQKVFITK